ncbi:gamma-glutamyltransferase family protein [Methylobacterium aerolatum]|uniref:Gamma-glutamyltranspeptidase/glutathione hydrolase n=1 Tax=Methylobacterium aerolatum TaxID=418708 RepID=A0ABU0HUN0_9HYPH|nr:gamma-glutamyltransferase family protein [Methylobacterium aerolatum]MDQ0445996.1 gamma-glutamyltranspeptidase/glutathione hydrolase [Methylobacterium aerolatum]GJD35033.1 Glutathione hydrolase-like YwrD proenzyme [Methylobacterium aerolatum]
MTYRHDAIYASRRSPVFARNLVATSQPLATQAGLVMLERGGNALDAAIAAAITLTVVEPTGNGIGSDAFCVLWAEGELHGLNASGHSPAAWTPERYARHATFPVRGWDTVTVPGAVSAWVELSRRFGRLPFETLFEPAIRYAEGGFLVTPVIAELWRRGAAELKDQPGFAETFMPGGRAPAAGELFRAPGHASTLRAIAETRGEAFYRGALAETMADFARRHGAALTEDDLAAHEADWCGTLSQDFAGASLHEIPPNGQGIAALMALGILQAAGIEDLPVDSAAALHLQIEAMKLALADVYAYAADPRHMTRVTPAHLLDPAYLARRAALIDRSRAQVFGAGAPHEGGTVCLATGDAEGMMVSYIQSNYAGFGSGVVVPGTGISLQNRGFGFTLAEGHPNRVGPRKRPFNTIIPGFVMQDGAPLMAFGCMGGPIQAQGHLQILVRTQLWGQDVQTAADAPRWRHVAGQQVAVEVSFPAPVLSGLEALGHELIREPPDSAFGFGGAQLVRRLQDGYVGGSDPRKDGQTGGF